MKQILPLTCHLFSIVSILSGVEAIAQHSPQERKQFKISKIIKQSVNSDANNMEKYENHYDNNGNETTFYINGEQFTKSVNEYNQAGKLTKVVNYDITGTGLETSNSVYTYNADRSYTVKTTDKSFGTVDFKWYDKAGHLTRTMAPDKIEDIYTYDAEGKLISVITKPGTSDADVTDLKYTYNKKGQRSKEVSEGTYRWTRTYTYDAKGVLSKVVTVVTDEGVKTTTTDTYKYEFWQ